MSERKEIELHKTQIQEYLPKYGGAVACYRLLEKETRPAKIARICSDVDHIFGANPAENVGSFMPKAVEFYEQTQDKQIISLAGFSHLVLAEQMAKNGFAKEDINKEIDKACALIDMAKLGGRNPLLSRAVKLKRRINLKDYVKLGITTVLFACFIILVAYLYRKVMDNSDLFFS